MDKPVTKSWQPRDRRQTQILGGGEGMSHNLHEIVCFYLKLDGAVVCGVKRIEEIMCIHARICNTKNTFVGSPAINKPHRALKEMWRRSTVPPWGKNCAYMCLNVSSFTIPLGHSCVNIINELGLICSTMSMLYFLFAVRIHQNHVVMWP